MRLAGKVALITGAAKGQGRQAVETFVREGARLVASDIDAAGLDETVQRTGAGPQTVVPVVGDVSVRADVERMVQAAREAFGALHILYNNAGLVVRGGDGVVTEVTDEAWEKTLAINLSSVMYACRAAIPLMIESGGGSIINIASAAALVSAGPIAYTASKGAITAMTRAIAGDYGRFGIRCNALCPGVIMTPFHEGGPYSDEGRVAKTARFNPIKRVGQAEDVVNLALYLASEESTFMTGAIIPIDGGATAR